MYEQKLKNVNKSGVKSKRKSVPPASASKWIICPDNAEIIKDGNEKRRELIPDFFGLD